MLMCDIDLGILSVRPEICHALVLYQNGLTHHHTFFILVSPIVNNFAKFQLGHPPRRRWIQVRYMNFAIFDEYLAICIKTIKIEPLLLGTLIGNHTRSIEPRHFRYLSVTFDGDLLTVAILSAQLTRDLLFRTYQCHVGVKVVPSVPVAPLHQLCGVHLIIHSFHHSYSFIRGCHTQPMTETC